MTKQLIDIGTTDDDRTGDPLRTAFDKGNNNFDELFAGAKFFPIISRTTPTTEPGAPSDGDVYIIPTSATGTNWAGNDGKLAIYSSDQAAWTIFTPGEGAGVWIADEDDTAYWDGAAWSPPASVPTEATASEIWVGTETTKYVSPAKALAAGALYALTSGTTITPDGDNGFNFSLTLAHNATLANPSNFDVGRSGIIVITQDGTGSRTLAYGTNWKFPGGAPVLSTAAGAIDVLAYFVAASGLILCTLTKAYSS